MERINPLASLQPGVMLTSAVKHLACSKKSVALHARFLGAEARASFLGSAPFCIFLRPSPVYPGSMSATADCFMNAMESEPSAIARGLRRRDPDLLDRLIEQYQHRLLRYLVSLTADRAMAEDLFQETWMRVLERGHQYDGRHEFSTWLYTIARNLTIDHLRRKRPAVSLDALMEGEDSAVPYEPPSTALSALDTVAQHEVAERVTAAMSGL